MSLFRDHEPVVVKISGGLLYPPKEKYLKELARVLVEISNERPLGVVVGGGRLAREIIAETGFLNNGFRDILGIQASRLNALVLSLSLFPRALPRVPSTVDEAAGIISLGKIAVMGGENPGQSTNAVALSLAEVIGASVVVNLLHGVDGVYDRDPSSPDAVKFDVLDLDSFERIIKKYEQVPGGYKLLDHIALDIAKRSGIAIVFANGEDPSIIKKIIINKENPGTIVIPRKVNKSPTNTKKNNSG